jgi:hypothetical protein
VTKDREDNTPQVSPSGAPILTGMGIAKVRAEIQARFKDVRVKQRELLTPATLDEIRRRFNAQQLQPIAETVMSEASAEVTAVPQNKRRVPYEVRESKKPADQLYADALRSLGFAEKPKANPLAVSATARNETKKSSWWKR